MILTGEKGRLGVHLSLDKQTPCSSHSKLGCDNLETDTNLFIATQNAVY
jgi:hypothetical protein